MQDSTCPVRLGNGFLKPGILANWTIRENIMAGIPPIDFLKYFSATLTNNDWQKKKGRIGKMKKTGLGPELKKVESLVNKVNMVALDPASSPSKTIEELDKKVASAKIEYQKSVEPLRKQLFVTKSKAEEAAKKLKKMPLGGDAAKAATAVAKAAGQFALTCKSLDLEAPIAKVKADIQKKNALAKKMLSGSLQKFAVGAKAFLSDPTEKSWGSNIKQQGRSVSNSVAQLSSYRAKFWKDFEKFKGFDTNALKITNDPEFEKKATFIVKRAVGQVKAIFAFKP